MRDLSVPSRLRLKKQPNRKPLLVRPRPLEDQCRQDYLMTIVEDNHLPSFQALNKILGVSYADLVTTPTETLVAAIDGKCSLVEGNLVARAHGYDLNRLGLGGRSKICPECIASRVPTPPSFNLSFQFFCDSHQLLLHNKCQECSNYLVYRRTKRQRCPCGADLAAAERISVPEWLPQFFELFAPWRLPGNTRPAGIAELECDIARFLQGALAVNLSATWKLAYPQFGPKDLDELKVLIEDWPRNLMRKLCLRIRTFNVDRSMYLDPNWQSSLPAIVPVIEELRSVLSPGPG